MAESTEILNLALKKINFLMCKVKFSGSLGFRMVKPKSTANSREKK